MSLPARRLLPLCLVVCAEDGPPDPGAAVDEADGNPTDIAEEVMNPIP